MLRCGIQGTTREPATPRGLKEDNIRPLFGRVIYSPLWTTAVFKTMTRTTPPTTLRWATSLHEVADFTDSYSSTSLRRAHNPSRARRRVFDPSCSQTIKQVLHSFLPCRIAKGRPGEEVEASLPRDRETPLRPFGVTGIDYAGTLFVKVGGSLKKCYIALFTCTTTLAVHLELCLDLSTDKFLLALQRLTQITPTVPRRFPLRIDN
jgi:hypothetical protein